MSRWPSVVPTVAGPRGNRQCARSDRGFAGYTGCQRSRQTGYLCAADGSGGRPVGRCRLSILRARSLEAMDSFELNKILGAILGTCLGVLSHQYRRRRDLRAGQAGQAGYEIAVPEQAPGGSRQAGRSSRAADRAAAGQGRRRPRRECRQEMRGLPHLQQGRAAPGRPQPVGRRRPAEGVGGRASTIRRRSRRKGGNWTIEDSTSSSPTRRACSGHQHDLCRHPAGERARRPYRLSQQPVRQSGAAAQGGGGRGRAEGAVTASRRHGSGAAMMRSAAISTARGTSAAAGSRSRGTVKTS